MFNPNIFMYGVWTVVIGLNCLHLFGIRGVSNEVYTMIIVGLVSYFMGGLLAVGLKNYRFVNRQNSFNKRGHAYSFSFNYRFIYILAYTTIGFLLIDTIIATQYLLNGLSFTQVRMWLTQTYESNSNPIFSRRGYAEQVFRVFVVAPFQMALSPLCAIEFFFGNRNRKLLWLTIIIQGFSLISGGGARFGIIILGISFLTAYSMYKAKNHNADRYSINSKKRKMRILIAVGVILVLIITTKRTSAKIMEEAYFYFALCLPLLSLWLPVIKTVPHTYGMVSLFGVTRIPFLFLEKLGIYNSTLYSNAYDYVLQANSFRNISSGTRVANSFVTPYYYLYLDGGYTGIIIGMILIGYAVNRCYYNVKNGFDMRTMYIMLLADIGLFYTFIRLELTVTNYFLALLAMPLLFVKTDRGGRWIVYQIDRILEFENKMAVTPYADYPAGGAV